MAIKRRELRASQLLSRLGACWQAIKYVETCRGKSFEETWHNANPEYRIWLLDVISDPVWYNDFYVMPRHIYAEIDAADDVYAPGYSNYDLRNAEITRRMPWRRLAPYIKKLIIKLEKEGNL